MRKQTIRASEIGTYLFCKRVWWYQRQGHESQNQAEMAAGSSYHSQHGQAVFRSIILQIIGWVILIIALVLLVIWLTQRIYP